MAAYTYAALFAQNTTKNRDTENTMVNITSNFYLSKAPNKNKKSRVGMGLNLNWEERGFLRRS